VEKSCFIIGDIGGHVDELYAELVRAGADPNTLLLPENVSVIQVGDLIDRGPESLACVELARDAWRVNSGRYIQLAGNHELNYLAENFVFVQNTPATAVEAVISLAEEGAFYVAAGIGNDWLVTHAGVTRGFWKALGGPDVERSVVALNSAWGTKGVHAALVKPGSMLTGKKGDFSAGPFWAEAGHELYASWLGHPMPFSQAHGHNSAYWWDRGIWSAGDGVAALCVKDEVTRRVEFRSGVGEEVIVGLDPGLGKYAGVRFEPLCVEGTAYTKGPTIRPLG